MGRPQAICSRLDALSGFIIGGQPQVQAVCQWSALRMDTNRICLTTIFVGLSILSISALAGAHSETNVREKVTLGWMAARLHALASAQLTKKCKERKQYQRRLNRGMPHAHWFPPLKRTNTSGSRSFRFLQSRWCHQILYKYVKITQLLIFACTVHPSARA